MLASPTGDANKRSGLTGTMNNPCTNIQLIFVKSAVKEKKVDMRQKWAMSLLLWASQGKFSEAGPGSGEPVQVIHWESTPGVWKEQQQRNEEGENLGKDGFPGELNYSLIPPPGALKLQSVNRTGPAQRQEAWAVYPASIDSWLRPPLGKNNPPKHLPARQFSPSQRQCSRERCRCEQLAAATPAVAKGCMSTTWVHWMR